MATIKRRRMIPLLILCFLLFSQLGQVCFADNPTGMFKDNIEQTPGLSSSNYTFNLVYIIIVLLLIIGMILLLIKFLAKKNKIWMANRAVRLLGGLNLGQNKAVQIIEVGHSIYLIGVGQDIQLIDKIDNAEEVSFILNLVNNNDPSFRLTEKLQSLPLPKWVNNVFNPNKAEMDDTNLSFQDVFQNKIKQLTNRKKRVGEIIEEETTEDRSNDK